jgi:hypothetical protein
MQQQQQRALLHPTQVCVNPTQVCVNPTQVCVNPSQVCVNPTQVCVNPTQVCVNPTQVCVHPTQVCVHPTQVCVNPTQVCVNPSQVCVNPTQEASRTPIEEMVVCSLLDRWEGNIRTVVEQRVMQAMEDRVGSQHQRWKREYETVVRESPSQRGGWG